MIWAAVWVRYGGGRKKGERKGEPEAHIYSRRGAGQRQWREHAAHCAGPVSTAASGVEGSEARGVAASRCFGMGAGAEVSAAGHGRVAL